MNKSVMHDCTNILFLDIDGVLNKGLIASANPPDDIIKFPHGWMNKSLVHNLNQLTAQCDAKLVISSSWRREELEDTISAIQAFGIEADIIGQTPELGVTACRGDEIELWLSQNKSKLGVRSCHEYKHYLILDDTADMLPSQSDHFLQTDAFLGLTAETVKFALQMMQKF